MTDTVDDYRREKSALDDLIDQFDAAKVKGRDTTQLQTQIKSAFDNVEAAFSRMSDAGKEAHVQEHGMARMLVAAISA